MEWQHLQSVAIKLIWSKSRLNIAKFQCKFDWMSKQPKKCGYTCIYVEHMKVAWFWTANGILLMSANNPSGK